jgi:hypothetical protein
MNAKERIAHVRAIANEVAIEMRYYEPRFRADDAGLAKRLGALGAAADAVTYYIARRIDAFGAPDGGTEP